ncbi:MAG: hypothetical protein OXN24_00825 [Candidatus Dadabacteria bacterium]|nr:hypothetical protein [Candidatus Dadabacteria bacterium]MDE0403983.1 hypothetical protein [Nitrospira sp.]MDE0504399.1 hypothetical protein [Candidatus Poribacteria bacterium]
MSHSACNRILVVSYITVLLAAVLTTMFPASVIASGSTEQFQLFNECRPMNLFITLKDSDDTGLTKERIQIAAESRLRSARLYTATLNFTNGVLWISVHGVEQAFQINASYMKVLFDPVSEQSFPAVTWSESATGIHARDAAFILQGVSELLDKFILEYLRVNEAACSS